MCVGEATCQDGVNEYRCICPPRYYGIHCEKQDSKLPQQTQNICIAFIQNNLRNVGLILTYIINTHDRSVLTLYYVNLMMEKLVLAHQGLK